MTFYIYCAIIGTETKGGFTMPNMVLRCADCGYEGKVVEFLDYEEGAFPKQRCPSCGSEKIITEKKQSPIPTITGRVCQFCGKKEIKYFSFNSTREDSYFSDNLTCCEDDACKEALKRKVISYDNNPKLVLISSFSPLSFSPRDRVKAGKFFRKITSKTIPSHPR